MRRRGGDALGGKSRLLFVLQLGGAIFDIGHSLGDLPDHRAEHRNVGLDRIEAPTGIKAGHGIDALAQNSAGLRIGREQAREVFNGFFEPVFGALAQDALHQNHADAAHDNGGKNGFDGCKGQPKIGGCADADR